MIIIFYYFLFFVRKKENEVDGKKLWFAAQSAEVGRSPREFALYNAQHKSTKLREQYNSFGPKNDTCTSSSSAIEKKSEKK